MAALALSGMGSVSGCSSEQTQEERPTVRDIAWSIIDQMSVEEKAAQLLIPTADQLTGLRPAVDSNQIASIEMLPVCGSIFFAHNLASPDQARRLLNSLQDAMIAVSGVPPLLCIDEEGGSVQRVGGRDELEAPYVGNMSEVGSAGDEAIAQEAARTIARSLKSLGFNTDFAPSCDVATNEESVMRYRSFGSEPELVARMAVAQIRAFEEENLLCCAKHFPGIGDPNVDSHNRAIYSEKTREELEAQLIPFAAAIEAGVPLIMTGHLSLPLVTGNDLPSSISPAIVQGILRDQMGYDGVVVTDSLSMGALRGFVAVEDLAVAAIEAGCDIALMAPDFMGAYNRLVEAIKTERISMDRIDQSLERILMLKLRALPELFVEPVRERLATCE